MCGFFAEVVGESDGAMRYIIERLTTEDSTHWAYLQKGGDNSPLHRMDVTKMDVIEGQSVRTHFFGFSDHRVKPEQILNAHE